MTPNDTFTLRFVHEDPDRHDIGVTQAWEVLGQIDTLLRATIRQYVTDADPEAQVRLVASPRPGSLELTLVLTMGTVVAFRQPLLDHLKDKGISLTTLADLSGIGSLVVALAFAPWGAVATETNQAQHPPPEAECEVVAELVDSGLGELNARVRNLVHAASQAGCKRVEVQVRDYAPVRLEQFGPPIFASAPAAQRPPDLKIVTRSSEAPIPTGYEGQDAHAFIAAAEGGPPIVMVVVNQPMPRAGEKFEVKGQWLPEGKQLRAESTGAPRAYTRAAGVFIVERWREAW